ncbi:MAG: hypothetical protein RBQ97_03220 [Acholeplasma sp.]|nr:hypothetical protein [Acholeplasma sp.]
MLDKKFGKNVLMVIVSNGVRLLSSVLMIFVVPLIFSQQDYGFYKIFLLYISYVGILHFGFIDGIYLKYGGVNYNDLNKEKFRSYSKFMIITQFIVAVIVFFLSFLFEGDRRTIIMLVALNLIAVNLTYYYQYVSQVTERFKEFAIRNIIYTVLSIVLIGVFFFFKIKSYILFITITVVINYLLLFWYMITYRSLSFGNKEDKKIIRIDIKNIFILGIPLLLSNLMIILISNIPKQYVDIKYPVENFPSIFPNFSFAYTLLGFTGVFLSAVSLVIYPTLKKENKDRLKENYKGLNSLVLGLVFILLVAFYPVSWIVLRFLSDYKSALDIFYILAPGIAMTSAITVVGHNYYKTYNKNIKFLFIGVITIGLLLISLFLINFVWDGNILYVAIATVLVQFIWYLMVEIGLKKEVGKISFKNLIFSLVASTLFYTVRSIDNLFYGAVIYIVLIILIVSIFFYKDIRMIIKKFRKSKLNSSVDV